MLCAVYEFIAALFILTGIDIEDYIIGELFIDISIIIHNAPDGLADLLIVELIAAHGDVVAAHDHILSRADDGLAVLGLEDIVCCEHEEPCLGLSLNGKGYMHGHLVAVEVGIECGTYKGMELNCPALDKHGFECLYAEPMERRSTVQKHGMILDNILEHIPYLGTNALNHTLCRFDVMSVTELGELFHYEGLEELERHFLRETALIHLELGAYDDNGTAGIVYTLTEEVLAEASLLTAKHIGKGFESTVAGTRYGAAAAAVINKSINGFLKHTLFVADDDIRRTQLQKPLEAVISVDYPAIEVVKVAGREPAAIEGYHGAKIGRNYGNDIEDDPFRLIAALDEGLDDFEPLYSIGALLAGAVRDLLAKLDFGLFKVDLHEKLFNGFRTHTGFEALCAVFFLSVMVFLIGKELLIFKGSGAGIRNHIGYKIQYLFKAPGAHIEQHLHAAGDTLEIPDMGNGSGKLDMTHALAANLGLGDLDAAFFADYALVADALIPSAVAFPVLSRSEDALAVKAVPFGLKSSIIDGLGLFDLAVRPFANLFG